MLIAAEYNDFIMYMGGRWDMLLKLWASKKEEITFPIGEYTVTITLGDKLVLTEDKGLAVLPGHDKEGETAGTPSTVEATLTKEEVEEHFAGMTSVHYVVALTQEVGGKAEPDFLLHGDIPVVTP